MFFVMGCRKGCAFSSTIINDHFIGGESLLNEMVNFLHSVIYRPLINDDAFETVTFARQKQNLLAYT